MFIYLPEIAFDMEQFFIDLDSCRKKHKRIVIVMSEGIKDKTGMFISEYGINDTNVKDSFGHVQLGGLAATMANIIRNRTGAKVRGIELSLLQRCAAHCASTKLLWRVKLPLNPPLPAKAARWSLSAVI